MLASNSLRPACLCLSSAGIKGVCHHRLACFSLSACMYMGKHQIPWTQSPRQLWDIMWVLGIEPGSSGRAAITQPESSLQLTSILKRSTINMAGEAGNWSLALELSLSPDFTFSITMQDFLYNKGQRKISLNIQSWLIVITYRCEGNIRLYVWQIANSQPWTLFEKLFFEDLLYVYTCLPACVYVHFVYAWCPQT